MLDRLGDRVLERQAVVPVQRAGRTNRQQQQQQQKERREMDVNRSKRNTNALDCLLLGTDLCPMYATRNAT